MERYIWFVDGPKAAKIAWSKDAASGVYFSPRGGKISSAHHYSYHSEGQRHLKVGSSRYIGIKQATALHDLNGEANIGGFGLDPKSFAWEEARKVKPRDIVFKYNPAMRLDVPLLASLHVAARPCSKELLERVWSSGEGFAYDSTSFELKSYPNLLAVVALQFQVSNP